MTPLLFTLTLVAGYAIGIVTGTVNCWLTFRQTEPSFWAYAKKVML